MTNHKPLRLGDILLVRKLVTYEGLEAALDRQRREGRASGRQLDRAGFDLDRAAGDGAGPDPGNAAERGRDRGQPGQPACPDAEIHAHGVDRNAAGVERADEAVLGGADRPDGGGDHAAPGGGHGLDPAWIRHHHALCAHRSRPGGRGRGAGADPVCRSGAGFADGVSAACEAAGDHERELDGSLGGGRVRRLERALQLRPQAAAGDQGGAHGAALWAAGQRQDKHRNADRPAVPRHDLRAARDRGERPDHQGLRCRTA